MTLKSIYLCTSAKLPRPTPTHCWSRLTFAKSTTSFLRKRDSKSCSTKALKVHFSWSSFGRIWVLHCRTSLVRFTVWRVNTKATTTWRSPALPKFALSANKWSRKSRYVFCFLGDVRCSLWSKHCGGDDDGDGNREGRQTFQMTALPNSYVYLSIQLDGDDNHQLPTNSINLSPVQC